MGPTEDASRPKVGVIVAGMHRSGTSATARVINLLGADITRDLMTGSLGDNDTGFWESAPVAILHDQLLRELGSAWDDPIPLPDGWLTTEVAQQTKHRLAEELKREFSNSHAFVAKDPRITRLLPLWLEIFDELGIEPIVVIPFRNPLEIAISLMRRNQFPLAKSMLLFLCSNLEVELASRGRRRIFVRYETLMADWRPFAMQLQKVGEARLPVPPAESQHEINSFLSSELHRNRSSRDELACTPDIAETILESYDRMVEAADTGDEARLRPSFDQARGTVAEATKLFHGLISSERAKQREAAAALAKSNAALDTRAAEISGLDVEVVRLNREVARLNGEVTAEHDRTVALKAGLEAKAAEVVRLSGQVTEWRKQATFVEQELEARRQLLEAVRQSTSWQFTALFRWISNKSSGLARRIRRGVHMIAGR